MVSLLFILLVMVPVPCWAGMTLEVVHIHPCMVAGDQVMDICSAVAQEHITRT